MGCRRAGKRSHDTIQKGLALLQPCLLAANSRRDSFGQSALRELLLNYFDLEHVSALYVVERV
jgi:hypothetical protein